jgi:hypothetical protein
MLPHFSFLWAIYMNEYSMQFHCIFIFNQGNNLDSFYTFIL